MIDRNASKVKNVSFYVQHLSFNTQVLVTGDQSWIYFLFFKSVLVLFASSLICHIPFDKNDSLPWFRWAMCDVALCIKIQFVCRKLFHHRRRCRRHRCEINVYIFNRMCLTFSVCFAKLTNFKIIHLVLTQLWISVYIIIFFFFHFLGLSFVFRKIGCSKMLVLIHEIR